MLSQLGLFDPLKWRRVFEYLPNFLMGVRTTISLSVAALLFATAVGIVAGVMRLSRRPLVSGAATVYIEVIRNTPLLVQLFIVYYGLGPL
jgi:polar amino acid transport system permease protein